MLFIDLVFQQFEISPTSRDKHVPYKLSDLQVFCHAFWLDESEDGTVGAV